MPTGAFHVKAPDLGSLKKKNYSRKQTPVAANLARGPLSNPFILSMEETEFGAIK